MKESKLIEMQNNINTLGAVCKRITQEIEMLKTMVMGDHEVIKRMSEFKEIINQLKEERDEQKDADGSTSGDSGSLDTSE